MVYQRLCGVEKAKNVALITWMRKLLTTLNAMLKHRTRWRRNRLSTLDSQDSC
jgi:transposase